MKAKVVFATFVVSISLILERAVFAIVTIDTEIVKKAVVFIYPSDDKGEVDKSKQLGTGFLVGIPSKADPKISYVFLVTARHIVDPVWAGCATINPNRLYIRVNRAGFDPTANESGVRYFPIDLAQQGKRTWFGSMDEHVDAAVLNVPDELAKRQEEYEAKYISYDQFGKPEEIKKLGVGSDVASAGLVPGLQGVRRNYPIFKFGKIANIPDEMATFKCTKDSYTTPVRVWWLAMNQVGGNSGAPIFFTPLFPPGGFITSGEPRAMIIGLQSLAVDGGDIAGMTEAKYIIQIIGEHVDSDADLTLGVPEKK
jgi:hypothetical protein